VTRCYRPPEIFFGDRNYTTKVDIWSAGCVIFELLTDKILFEGSSDLEVVCKVFEIRGTPVEGEWPECEGMPCYIPFEDQIPVENLSPDSLLSDSQNELLKQMLSLNPKHRPSTFEILKLFLA